MTKLHELQKLGQSVWLDYISRSLISSGGLTDLVRKGVRGVTSNPTIFEKAIAGSADYDDELKRLASAGKSAAEIYDALVTEDIRNAADALRPVYDESEGADGFVSLEVSPALAHDTQQTIADAIRYFKAVNRPNVMIKVPASQEGLPAIRELIGHGINVNVTLMFGIQHYRSVADAYIGGLETLDAAGGNLNRVASVASFFVSRVDTKADPLLESKGVPQFAGKLAIANSRLAYDEFKKTFFGPRWEKLAAKGARVQRVLWASTSTKNPNYKDTLYIDELIGAHTVNTLPPNALEAFLEHGIVKETITAEIGESREMIASLASLGIDFDALTETLQTEGIDAFAKSFEALMKAIEAKRARYAA